MAAEFGKRDAGVGLELGQELPAKGVEKLIAIGLRQLVAPI